MSDDATPVIAHAMTICPTCRKAEACCANIDHLCDDGTHENGTEVVKFVPEDRGQTLQDAVIDALRMELTFRGLNDRLWLAVERYQAADQA